jgi:anti-sigma regulatory factor (Ser/Thr protein kinase)
LELAPGELLAQVEHLVERLAAETAPEQRDTVGATCLYAVYDPTTCQCTLASAGHPPPILITPNGATRVLDLPLNPPLGVGWAPFQSISIEVEPGSVLAMYTDGLFQLDRRNRDLDLDRVQSQLAASGRQARSLREWCDSLAPDATNITLPDDFAILLARTRAVGSQDVSSWQFPADLTSVANARTLVVRQLTDWHLDHLVFTTELVVSELITNAIRYAGGPVSLRLIRGKELICEVADHSNTQPRLVRAATTDEGGRGLYIVAQCTSRWGCRYGEKGKTIWTELPLNNEGA